MLQLSCLMLCSLLSPGASAEKLASHFRCGHSDMAGVLCTLEEEFEVYRSGAAYHIM